MVALSAEQLRDFGRDGYLVIHGVVDEALLAAADNEIDAFLPTRPPNMDGSPDADGEAAGRHGWSYDAGLLPRCEDVLRQAVLPVAEQLVAPHTLDHRFGHTQIATTVPPYPHIPGGPHIDNHAPGEHIQESFTVLAGVLLTDQSESQMGNLWVWPHSHRDHSRLFHERGTEVLRDVWGHVTALDPPFPIGQPVELMGERGDLVLAHFLTGHNGGGNQAHHTRRTIYYRLATPRHADRWEATFLDPLHEYGPVADALGETDKTADRPADEVLKAGRRRTVVRVGDTVRRPQYPWSPSVHSLLVYLEAVGFPWAPRFLGIDEDDREVLSFIDGVAGADGYIEGVEFGAHAWSMVSTTGGLQRFARLLREYHDAVAGFRPEPDASWSSGSGAPANGEIVCHNDFGPWNVVWVDGRPVGIIDWDYAAPALPVADVAYALEWAVPFCSDEECLKWRRFEEPPDRRSRIEIFATAYGLADTTGLVDAVLARQHVFRQLVIDLGSRGLQPAADELESGYLDAVDARIRWTLDHRNLLE